jgi:hypothetical protein
MLYLIGGLFNWLGILFVSSSTGLIGYLLITRISQFNEKLNSPVIPTVVNTKVIISLIGYGIHRVHCRLHFYGSIWNFSGRNDALLFIG